VVTPRGECYVFRLTNGAMHQMAEAGDLVRLTAEIVSAHAGGNSLAADELPVLIMTVHHALTALGRADANAETAATTEQAGAVSVRKSLSSPDKIISMIDGKSYRTLKRHIARHGFTPGSYRERFGLKPDYPMVAPAYSELRRTAAKAIGFGRKAVGVVAAGAAVVALAEVLVPAGTGPVKAARKARADKAASATAQEPAALQATLETPERGGGFEAVAGVETDAVLPAPKRRGRPPGPKADPVQASTPHGASLPESDRASEDEFFDIAKAPQSGA
jgi:predicted transcriptional regulator